jgi:shikimate dehydrogenase
MKYGLIGKGISNSLSPAIHRLIFQKLAMDENYLLFDMGEEEVENHLEDLRATGKGHNVTMPYKQVVMPLLDEIDPAARAIGAVNTISNEGGRLKGWNTDYWGFEWMLKRIQGTAQGKSVAFLGTGGVMKAGFRYFYDHGASEIWIVSRNPEKTKGQFEGADWFQDPRIHWLDYRGLEGVQGDYLVNCTPCGMVAGLPACAVPESVVKNFHSVLEVIYHPWETELLKMARKLSKPAENGFSLLLGQAIAAEEIWQKKTMPDLMFAEIYKELSNREEKK